MKKFLTVLLALSVVFTYTVGTAFATVGNPTTDNLTAAQKFVDDAVKVAEGKATLNNTTYSESAKAYAVEQSKLAAQLILKALIDVYDLDELDATAQNGMKDFKDEITAWTVGGTTTHIGVDNNLKAFEATYQAYFDKMAGSKDVEGRIADAIAKVNAIKTDVYSTWTYTVGSVDYTYQTYAAKLVADAVEDLGKAKTADEVNTILYGASGTEANPATDSLYGKLKALVTLEEQNEVEGGANVDVDYAKAQVAYKAKVELYGQFKVKAGDSAKAKFDGKFTNTELGDVTVYNEAKKIVMGVKVANVEKLTAGEASKINAAMMDILDKTVEVINVYFDELEIKAVGPNGTVAVALDGILTGNSEEKIVKALTAIAKYEEAVKKADKMKSAVMFDGSKKYNDAEVDTALAKDKTDIYANFLTPEKVANYLGQVISVVDPVANAIASAKEKFEGPIVLSGANKTAEADKKYKKDFYDVFFFGDDYDEIVEDAVAELDEAKTIDEVNAIMANAETELAELRTQAERDAIVLADYIKYEKAVKNYADEVMKGLKGNDYRPDSFNDVVKVYIGSLNTFGIPTKNPENAGKIDLARNLDEVKALYEEAKAEIDKLLSDEELKAEAKKVADLITALPANATLETEEQFMAVNDAYEAYCDLYGAKNTDVLGYLVFESKMNTLKTLQETAVEDAIKAFPAVVTLADKEAVETARAMYDKYADYYGDDFVITNLDDLKKAEKAIYNAEVKNVKDMILNLTKDSSAAELKAAMDAYNALTGSQQRAVRDNLGEYMYKLEMAKDYMIESVKSLKVVKNHSTVGKGYIKLAWSTKGDTSAVQGYQVFRSKKMNSGYGTKPIFTTKSATAKTYKNTAVKKGTKYYYKVRAFVEIDGQKYYSDWSNKAYRTAK